MAQDVSSNLTQALSGDRISWRPETYADWANDGYGARHSIDDLTDQMGQVTVTHSMDDGLPDELSFLSGGVPQMGGNLAGRDGLTPAQYWSPFRSDSPVFGYERDLVPVKTDLAVVTAGGIERVRLFTGRTQDTPVRGGRASLSAISETRLRLTQLVQPPVHDNSPLIGLLYGLTGLWPVSYALWKTGVDPSPPPQTGTRLFLPLHGGGMSYIPDTNPLGIATTSGILHGGQYLPVLGFSQAQLKTIRGPYAGGCFGQVKTTIVEGGLSNGYDLEPGDPFWTTLGSTGRWEMWVRGDTFDNVNTTPSGSGGLTATSLTGRKAVLTGFGLTQGSTTTGLEGGIGADRLLFLQLWDPALHFMQGPALPSDGLWHFVGIAWSGTGNKAWFNLDGVVTTATPAPAIVTGTLSTGVNTEGDKMTNINCWLPTAEIHLTSGTTANPDTGNPWVAAQDWTQRADIYPSAITLDVVAEPKPIEAYQLVSEYARAELAAVHIDEHDVLHYWPRGYFATDVAQTTRQALDTDRHAALPDVALDRSRIRTACRVTYRQTFVIDNEAPALEVNTIQAFLPGQTLIRLGFTNQIARIRLGTTGRLANMTSAVLDGTDTFNFPQESFVSYYNNTDAIGSPAVDSQMITTVLEWTCAEALLLVENFTTVPYYLVNPSNSLYAYLVIRGSLIFSADTNVTEFYDAGVDIRGSIALTVNMPRVLNEVDAYRMARQIVVGHAFPIPVVPQVTLFGDPTRQVGDLVTFVDDAETGADGAWRVHSIGHSADGASYTQDVRLQRARLRGVWGDDVSQWGRVVWAGQEPQL